MMKNWLVLLSLVSWTIPLFSWSGQVLAEEASFGPASRERQAQAVLRSVESALHNVQSYRCKLSTLCILGAKREERTFDYVFRKPKLIRMRILKGPDRGSTLVYKENRVVVRLGGLLSLFRRTYEPEHKKVTTIRGGRVDETDFWFIIDLMRQPTHTLRYRGQENLQGTITDVLELAENTAPANAMYKTGKFWVGRDFSLVVKYELYDREDRLAFRQTHEEVQLNPELSKDFF